MLTKFNFKIDSGSSNITYSKIVSSEQYETLDKRIISCFITENNIIVCFYYSKTVSKYSIMILSTNLEVLKEENLDNPNNNYEYFYKCIHLKKEIGIFVYYIGNDASPKIKIIEISESNSVYSLNDYITDFVESLPVINSKKYFSYNDIIKLSDYLICFATCDDDKEILIIELINFYGEKKFNIRDYVIPNFKLYNFKFLWEIKLHKYNQNALFAFSFCK